MAESLQFDLVSPERPLASMAAREVRLPGSEGAMTALPDHAPTITTLRPGIVAATGTDGTVTSFAVTGGFADVTGDAASILAERATPATAEYRAEIEEHLAAARTRAAEAEEEHKDTAEMFVADLVRLLEDME
jgi:F-type H+-transporting ATPase subunit epsilon